MLAKPREPANDAAVVLAKPSGMPTTMSSLEIAERTGKEHFNVLRDTRVMLKQLGEDVIRFEGMSSDADVRRSIDRLAERGVISFPPMAEVKVQRERRAETVSIYLIGKRDSYVIVAQLSPEFTARLVDRWQELEAAAPAAPAGPVFDVPKTFAAALLLAAGPATAPRPRASSGPKTSRNPTLRRG